MEVSKDLTVAEAILESQKLIYSAVAPDDWDDKLTLLPGIGRFEQSSLWAQIEQRISAAKAIYLQVFQGDRLIASLLCFDRKPWDPIRNKKNKSLFIRFSGRIRGSLGWLWGPSYFSENEDEIASATKLMMDWIVDYSGREKLLDIRGYLSDQNTFELNESTAKIIESRAFYRKTWASLLIDLTVNEEMLWSNMKASARKAVNKANRLNIRIEEILSTNDFNTNWLASYRKFEVAAGRKVYSEEWFRTFWDFGHGKTHRYFVALDSEATVMAVLGMNVFNKTAREFNSAMNPIAYEKRIPAQDLLHWEMIKVAKNDGCTIFNLAGVDPEPKEKKARGIRQFKEKWGGRYVEYPRLIKKL